ncbi:MAG: hypothetical protein ACOCR0_03315 [Haloferacaceae archaeon]
MQFKLIPPAPADLETVERAQRAVPLVPGSENDCCARLQSRLDLPSRDVARTWLTFLRALELAEETPSGFTRRRVDPTPEHLRDAFLRRVYGADHLLIALREGTEPMDVQTAYEQFRHRVPTWETYKQPDWEDVWRERVGVILEWFVLLDLAERTDEGYVPTERPGRI